MAREYRSKLREAQAKETRSRIIEAAKELFQGHGFEEVKISQIAKRAGVSPSSLYALFQSKLGVLREVMYGSPTQYEALVAEYEGKSPKERMEVTAKIARHLRECEIEQQELFRGAAILHSDFKELELEREAKRYEAQLEGIEWLVEHGALAHGLTVKTARDIMWALTGRDLYRMLVIERGWTGDEYEEWLSKALCNEIIRN